MDNANPPVYAVDFECIFLLFGTSNKFNLYEILDTKINIEKLVKEYINKIFNIFNSLYLYFNYVFLKTKVVNFKIKYYK